MKEDTDKDNAKNQKGGEIMGGKTKDDFDWLKERIGYHTDNEAFRQVNSMGYSPITTFRPGAWTIPRVREMYQNAVRDGKVRGEE